MPTVPMTPASIRNPGSGSSRSETSSSPGSVTPVPWAGSAARWPASRVPTAGSTSSPRPCPGRRQRISPSAGTRRCSGASPAGAGRRPSTTGCVAMGRADVGSGISLARSRLNLAKILDGLEAAAPRLRGGPSPSADPGSPVRCVISPPPSRTSAPAVASPTWTPSAVSPGTISGRATSPAPPVTIRADRLRPDGLAGAARRLRPLAGRLLLKTATSPRWHHQSGSTRAKEESVMSKRGRKRKARRKNSANRGKRPNS